jgi:hypothetical protein
MLRSASEGALESLSDIDEVSCPAILASMKIRRIASRIGTIYFIGSFHEDILPYFAVGVETAAGCHDLAFAPTP